MKSIIHCISFLSISLLAGKAQAQTTWNIDKSHTSINFSVTHMMVSETDGKFKLFSGTIISKNADFSDAQIEFLIDVNSINTDDESRDEHLKKEDFFNAKQFPQIKFKSSSFKKINGKNYLLEGDLTIRDVTKKVKFEVVYNGTIKDAKGNNKAGFKATSVINRTDYGLTWNKAIEAGGWAVSEEVNIIVNLELNQAK